MSPRRAGLVALASYAAFFILLFSPVLLTGRVLAPADGFRFHYPHFALPPMLWDPNMATGFPVAADPQVMTWYPPAMLRVVVPFTFNAFIIAAYVFASWFTFLYVGALTGDRGSAFIAGLVFGASGFMIGHVDYATILHAAVWLPLMVLALARLAATARARWSVVLALSTACCITAGHLQISFYAMALAVAYGVAIHRTAARPWTFLLTAAGAFAVGVLLTGVQLVPTLELVRLSTRSTMSYGEFVSYSLRPYELVRWLFPYLFGGVSGHLYPGPYFGPPGPRESLGYVGSGALVLAGIALTIRWREPIVQFWSGMAATGLVLALGGSTPIARLMFHIPIVNGFRAQGRFVMIADFAIAVLAGLGLDAVRRHARSRAWLQSAALAGPLLLALGAVVVWLLAPSLRPHAAAVGFPVALLGPLAGNAMRVPFAAASLVAVMLTIVAARPRSAAALAMLAVTIGLEIGSFAFFEAWRDQSPTQASLQMPAALEHVRDGLTRHNQRWLPAAGVFALRTQLPPDTAALWGVPSVAKFGPLLPRRYSELSHVTPYGGVEGDWGAYDDRALDLLSVRFVALPPARHYEGGINAPAFQAYVSNASDTRRWRAVNSMDEGRIVENMRVLPRVRLVTHTVTLAPADVLAAILTSRMPNGSVFDPATTALVEEPVALGDAQDVPATDRRARLIETGRSIVAIESEAPTTTLLVLADLFYPGWTATVDDRPAHVLVANYAQRGVVVPSGRHQVVFRYRPISLYAGAGVSALGLLGLVLLTVPAAGVPRASKKK